jgi:flagellar protein FliO/FliZ
MTPIRIRRYLYATLLGLLRPWTALAAGGTPSRFAAPAPPALMPQGGGALRVMLALMLVLAAVFAAAWLLRRLRLVGGAEGSELTILGQVSLGARERAVLLRVGQERLLLGVAAGSVRLLHALSEPAQPAASSSGVQHDGPLTATSMSAGGAAPSFRELLRRTLGR